MTTITRLVAHDRRFTLPPGAGSDAVHADPQYGYAVAELETDSGLRGVGLSFNLGAGCELVCQAIELLAAPLIGCEIEELMSRFGRLQRELADHPQLRWLGPHKGVLHLALSSLTNACFDLWARHRQQPLWELLLDLSTAELVALLDLSHLEDVLTADEAVEILQRHRPSRGQRSDVLQTGFPGYDTSVGWFQYSDDQIRDNARRAIDAGFTALKLKVGSAEAARDLRRVELVRDAVGDEIRLMLDANQAWSLPQALEIGEQLADLHPYWMEEPIHADDIAGHARLAKQLAPVPIAVGESIPNRVTWKNYLQAEAVGVVQADCTRLAGISEYLTVALLAAKRAVPVAPHVGDMGQLHQHLVLFQQIALNQPPLLLEHIPHLRSHFVDPADVRDGRYHTPRAPGASTHLRARS